MQKIGIQATGTPRVPAIPRVNGWMQVSQGVKLATMWKKRGVDGDVGRETSRGEGGGR